MWKDPRLAIQEALPIRPAHTSLYARDGRQLVDGRVELKAVESHSQQCHSFGIVVNPEDRPAAQSSSCTR